MQKFRQPVLPKKDGYLTYGSFDNYEFQGRAHKYKPKEVMDLSRYWQWRTTRIAVKQVKGFKWWVEGATQSAKSKDNFTGNMVLYED